MGLKDNFKQAAKELMDAPEPRSKVYEPPKLEEPADKLFTPEVEPAFSSQPEPAPMPVFQPEPEPVQVSDSMRSFGMDSFTSSYDSLSSMPAANREPVTVIAPGTVIRGSIQSDTDMELYGEVQGDIITSKNLKLKGRIQGNATGGNVELYSIRMVGNITASGTAELDAESEVEGDVIAESLILNGKIRGNVQVSKRLSLEGSAVICGKVTAERLSVDEGAIIQGEIVIGKAMVQPKPAKPAMPAARPGMPPQAARPSMPPVAPIQPQPQAARPAAARPAAAPKPPVAAAPKAPAAPAAAAPKPAAAAAPKAPAAPKPAAAEEKKESESEEKKAD